MTLKEKTREKKEQSIPRQDQNILWFGELTSDDVPLVGGKNASLGEMIKELKSEGIQIPDGFATTSKAYWDFIESNQIKDSLQENLEKLEKEQESLQKVGKAIRRLFTQGDFPE